MVVSNDNPVAKNLSVLVEVHLLVDEVPVVPNNGDTDVATTDDPSSHVHLDHVVPKTTFGESDRTEHGPVPVKNNDHLVGPNEVAHETKLFDHGDGDESILSVEKHPGNSEIRAPDPKLE